MPAGESVPFARSTEPASDVQTALVQWTCQLLNVPVRNLDAESELGQYGFNSISSAQLIDRINQAYDLQLSPKVFYEHPTLAGFARYLAEEHGSLLVAKQKRAGGEAVGGENRLVSPRTPQLEPIVSHAAHRSEFSAGVNGYHALSINRPLAEFNPFIGSASQASTATFRVGASSYDASVLRAGTPAAASPATGGWICL